MRGTHLITLYIFIIRCNWSLAGRQAYHSFGFFSIDAFMAWSFMTTVVSITERQISWPKILKPMSGGVFTYGIIPKNLDVFGDLMRMQTGPSECRKADNFEQVASTSLFFLRGYSSYD